MNIGGPSRPCNLPGRAGARRTWIGTCGWGPPLGLPTTAGASTAIIPPPAEAGARGSDYSGGGMTDWGAHKLGMAMFFAGVAEPGAGGNHPA